MAQPHWAARIIKERYSDSFRDVGCDAEIDSTNKTAFSGLIRASLEFFVVAVGNRPEEIPAAFRVHF